MTTNNLKKYRVKAKLSQNEVAEILNTSRQSISKWENGKVVLGADRLKELSELYGVSMDQLAGVKIAEDSKLLKNQRVDDTYALMLLLIALISFLGGPIGIFVECMIIAKNKISNMFGKTIYVVAVVGLVCGTYNTYSIVDGYIIHPQPDSEISIFI